MKRILAASIAAMLLAVANVGAQEGSKQQTVAPPAANEPYEPGLGEIMALQQMRHMKLWFAGHAGNWSLADYEIGELKEGFDEVSNRLGGDIVANAVGARISELERAISAEDGAAFVGAFDKLTVGCNSCHRTLDRGFIVIRRPTLRPYGNQSFTTQK